MNRKTRTKLYSRFFTPPMVRVLNAAGVRLISIGAAKRVKKGLKVNHPIITLVKYSSGIRALTSRLLEIAH